MACRGLCRRLSTATALTEDGFIDGEWRAWEILAVMAILRCTCVFVHRSSVV